MIIVIRPPKERGVEVLRKVEEQGGGEYNVEELEED